MFFLLFFLAAVFTVVAAVKLSTYADVISERTSLGGMLIGTVLLAGATSLPEVTTTISAIVIDNPDLAVGNVLGSNLFNILILASFDLYFRKKQMFTLASKEHSFTATIGLVLMLTTLASLIIQMNYAVLWLGLDTLSLLLIYIIGMFILTQMSKQDEMEQVTAKENADHHTGAISLKRAIVGFIIAAIVILGAGSLLTYSGDQVALITGLGSSFVGSFLIAASTSLPEAVSVLIAFQLRNYNLAIGSILGSNLFNILILVGADAIYQPGSIIAAVSSVHQITASAISLLAFIVLYSLLRKKKQSLLLYSLPSAVLVLLYFISSYLIFIQS